MFYSQMRRDELLREVDRLRKEMEIRKDQGLWNAVAVLEQKMNMALSYLQKDHQSIQVGQTYTVKGYPGVFRVTRIKGVMAWGTFAEDESREERAFPFNLLTPHQARPTDTA
ncbi:MAG: hypothetical protein BAA01_07220 [Bacillus thermozeamaize]|uniref:Uncharacterized protein n=1 Tax=Bacillus thermozeamaize TaxID=230954 RepID=A0A1Y3PTU4_9BACI|nr:MAG: hypothetical protein BAA01_07220 [Bacillus thermozeamaize]